MKIHLALRFSLSVKLASRLSFSLSARIAQHEIFPCKHTLQLLFSPRKLSFIFLYTCHYHAFPVNFPSCFFPSPFSPSCFSFLRLSRQFHFHHPRGAVQITSSQDANQQPCKQSIATVTRNQLLFIQQQFKPRM